MYLLPSTLADVEPKTEEQPNAQYVYAHSVTTELHTCNCVLFAKTMLGIKESLGVAKDIKPTSPVPYVGGLVITNESEFGHVAVITEIKNGYLYLTESNYVHCKITYNRKLPIDSQKIKGYR